MSKFCPKCTGMIPNVNMTKCPNCGADLSNVTEDVLDESMAMPNQVGGVNPGVVNNQVQQPIQQPVMQQPVQQQPMMQPMQQPVQQPQPDPTLNFANSAIFRESSSSASAHNDNEYFNTPVAMSPNVNFFAEQQPVVNNATFVQQPQMNNNMNNNMANFNNQMPQVQQNNNITTGSKVSFGEKVSYVSKKSPKLFIFGGIGLALLIIIIIAVIVLNSGPKAVVNKYVKGLTSYNADKMLSTMHPNVKKELQEFYDDQMYEAKDYAKSHKIKITKITVDSDYEDIKPSEIKYNLEELDRYYNVDKDKIKEIRQYEVEIKYTVDGEKEKDTSYITVYKYGSKWYVMG